MMSLDSLDFKNENIIITDPWYIVKDDVDWGKYNKGYGYTYKRGITKDLKKLGFKKVISYKTIIGDWFCKVIQIKNYHKKPFLYYEKIKLGEFMADAGLVAVFSLDEVLKHKLDYDYEENKKLGLATIIRDFTGSVSIERVDKETITVLGQGNIGFYSELLEPEAPKIIDFYLERLD